MADTSEIGRFLSPRVILPLLGLIVVAAVLFTPQGEMRNAEPRLTSYSAHANGARGIYETLQRLGWRVERRTEPFRGPLAADATYALLAPPLEPTSGEVHALLDAVRRGASLVVVPRRGSAVADSLGIHQNRTLYRQIVDSAGVYGQIKADSNECASDVSHQPLGADYLMHSLRAPTRDSSAVLIFLAVEGAGVLATLPAAAGYELGRGKVLAIADPSILRNDVVRLCDEPMGVLAVRMMTWLSPRGSRVVFDEYHHGHGTHPSVTRVVGRALAGTPPGRALLQAGVAAFVLLVAASVRPIPPRPRLRIERRSPLEHVGALARAYEQVGATRRAVRLLIRGLRRRHAVGALRDAGDEEFLSGIAAREPALASDVALLLDATQRPRSPEQFLEIGRAIERIERTITRRVTARAPG